MSAEIGVRPKALFFDFAAGVAVCAYCVAIFWFSLGLDVMRLEVPLAYVGDALQYSYIINSFSSAGGLGHIENAGAPFGTQNLDFPNADATNMLIASMLAPAASFGLRFNLFFLAGVILTSLAGFAVARSMGLGRLWSAAVAVAFTLLPFHFLRLLHLFYTNYSAAAVALWICVRVGREGPSIAAVSRLTRILSMLLFAGACIWCATTGVYYAFFTCIAVAASTVFAAFRQASWKPIRTGSLALALIVVATTAQLVESERFELQHGKNEAVAKRDFMDTEYYGLKIAQLLLPIQNHPWEKAAQVQQKYSARIVNENTTSSLGALGSLAFVLVIAWLCFRTNGAGLAWQFQLSCALVLVLLLYATVGGFGTLFSLLVTPQIRAVNRVSPFIAYACLVAAAGILQGLFKKKKAKLAGGIAALICIPIATFDQVPFRDGALAQQHQALEKQFDTDKQFAETLALRLPPGAQVFQLPFVEYPEAGSSLEYEQFKNLLHAPSLHWTYGAMKGRPESEWLKVVSSLDADRFAKSLRSVGFAALVVDNRYLTDLAKKQVQGIAGEAGVFVFNSSDGTQTGYIFGEAKFEGRAVAPGRGWHAYESWGMWGSERNASLILSAPRRAAFCELSLTLSTIRARDIDVMFDGVKMSRLALKDGAVGTAQLQVPSNTREIELRTDVPAQTPGNEDPRLISFGWQITDLPVCISKF